jgi:hypothetical protein
MFLQRLLVLFLFTAGLSVSVSAKTVNLLEAGAKTDGKTQVLDKGKTVFDIVAAPEGDGQSAKVALGHPQG